MGSSNQEETENETSFGGRLWAAIVGFAIAYTAVHLVGQFVA